MQCVHRVHAEIRLVAIFGADEAREESVLTQNWCHWYLRTVAEPSPCCAS